jgi:hypothetical protein
MKSLLFLLLLIINVSLFANDTLNIIPKTDFNRWSVGVNISPDYCDRTLVNNFTSPYAGMIIELRNKGEQFKIGYSVGVSLCYNLNKRMGVELGFSYSDMGYSTKENELTFGDAIDPRFGYTYPTSGTGTSTGYASIKIYYNHIYLNLPVRLVYRFGEKKNKFIAGIGLTTGYLIKSTSRIAFDNGESITISRDDLQYEKYNNYNIFPELSFGIERQLSQKLMLRVQPVLKYGLIEIIDAPNSTHLWSGGFNVGCYYNLK